MENQASFKHYVRAVRKRWWILALLAVIAVSGVYFRFGNTAPGYSASAIVMVTSSPLTSAPTGVTQGAPTQFASNQLAVMSNISELLNTRVIAERIARRLSRSDISRIQNSVTAVPPRSSNLLRIEATAATPKAAAELANGAATELSNFFRETNAADARRAREFVQQQLAEVRQRLDSSDRALVAARRNPTNAEGAANSIVSTYYSALTAVDESRIALREVEGRLKASVDRLSREAPTLISETTLLDNPAYRQIEARLTDLEIERAQLQPVYTPSHPRMRQLQGQIDAMRTRLAAEAQTQVGREVRTPNPTHSRLVGDIVTLQIERAATTARLAGQEANLRNHRAAVTALPTSQAMVTRLVRENQILDGRYRFLASQYQEALLRENLASFFPAGLQLVEAATAPERPRPSGVPRTAAAAGVAGIVLGIIAALFLEATDEAIKTPDDVERTLGVPVLAEVPNANAPRVTPANALFMAGFIIFFAIGLLGAYVRTPFAPVNTAGRMIRVLVLTPLQSGYEQLQGWVQSVAQAEESSIGAGQ
jgi:uncharacterized protein involved in exopolysaccharide biosynthesis